MYFIGMLAFHLPIHLGYDLPISLLSALLTIAAALLGFYVLRKPEKNRKIKAATKPFDVVPIFKMLVPQHLHNPLDDKTVWLFREQLKGLNLIDDNLPSTLRST